MIASQIAALVLTGESLFISLLAWFVVHRTPQNINLIVFLFHRGIQTALARTILVPTGIFRQHLKQATMVAWAVMLCDGSVEVS